MNNQFTQLCTNTKEREVYKTMIQVIFINKTVVVVDIE